MTSRASPLNDSTHGVSHFVPIINRFNRWSRCVLRGMKIPPPFHHTLFSNGQKEMNKKKTERTNFLHLCCNCVSTMSEGVVGGGTVCMQLPGLMFNDVEDEDEEV